MTKIKVYVVYAFPLDFPGVPWVVRAQHATADSVVSEPVAYGFQEIHEARNWLESMGLTRIERSPEDDPGIVESWV
jgi:hypothetical protein